MPSYTSVFALPSAARWTGMFWVENDREEMAGSFTLNQHLAFGPIETWEVKRVGLAPLLLVLPVRQKPIMLRRWKGKYPIVSESRQEQTYESNQNLQRKLFVPQQKKKLSRTGGKEWKIFLLNMARHTNNYGKTEV